MSGILHACALARRFLLVQVEIAAVTKETSPVTNLKSLSAPRKHTVDKGLLNTLI